MNVLTFHSVVLVCMGMSGLVWLLAAIRAREPWSSRRRASIGGIFCLIYLIECLQAFPEVGRASAAELFGFLGCFLGSAGALWQFITGLEHGRSRPPRAV